MIDREKVISRFRKYTDNYDLSDPKIALKESHTYRVAMLSERIARTLDFCKEDLDLAWLIGMLHDIARFEQCRIFDSFMDGATIDHAKFACHLLFGDDIKESDSKKEDIKIADYACASIDEFVDTREYDQIIHDAIYCHNLYILPDDLDERTLTFAKILRDADKIDILKVNVETPLEEIYNVSTEKLKSDEVTDEVLSELLKGKTILRTLKKTSVDNIAGHISLIFGLEYKESLKIIDQQKYIYKLTDFQSENPKTREQFTIIKDYINKYLQNAQK